MKAELTKLGVETDCHYRIASTRKLQDHDILNVVFDLTCSDISMHCYEVDYVRHYGLVHYNLGLMPFFNK